jgi:hypothetical protein
VTRGTLTGVQGQLLHRNGRPVAGFGLGGMALPEWVAARDQLQDTDRLIATGQGGQAAIATAARLRARMAAGLGDPELHAPPAHPSPWKYALVMSLVSTATGWVLEEVARRTFRKKRERH